MIRVLLTSSVFFGRLANGRLPAGVREARSVAENPTRVAEEAATTDLNHYPGGLDAVAGSEFVDDRIRRRD